MVPLKDRLISWLTGALLFGLVVIASYSFWKPAAEADFRVPPIIIQN